ncbi:FolD 5,10-methylene-tetrahydrofolate dehydrogenase/Methenyl tetrahydrofolate cyclohydrolase [Candidatus Methylopumilus universalis]|uniref:bifunctional methylenetetrahydrofolate dehydrogenase/methenyltetrahydrofolate cyclohydrolase FolD n=1 Tax=Candidatus Methylopumilus TaxID=1679002 RepID=UPI00112491A3|nr:bifunctional methylenetetrahydrofolate dehydrogenase/methenyltetrahydrofolate cyclohydrolase FolD [Candidatus Methylopumilus planktonicus]QDC99722.1 bifunctional methylenetetrahydrofolate dehydrogenase/methenyltetrahydrofolate cyclohydrolase FolD [Candidatus Methylopumilus planktonicus]QDD06319.1 bifunctional methylenetetrahydrofolate dehydrogenase/methenyltetrahydrofolate cyclohydrolase FolD [Candidatus Methylopumilus planktonicus]QDD07654.1 bifunctional methylenetetrahydrofolate dehydrogena
MSAKIIDGKAIAENLLQDLKKEIDVRSKKGIRNPSLAVVLIGSNPASSIYVKNKRLACEKIGVKSIAYDLPNETSEKELLTLIETLNNDTSIDGILVQSPLPSHINNDVIFENISPLKDVDGFHPKNIGLLAIKQPQLRSCTPYGVMKLIKATQLAIQGLDAIVVGSSNHVGRPMALELLLGGCTVTICNRYTQKLQQKIELADIVVAAAGIPDMIKGSWIKPGAIAIDIGINRLESGKIIGDIEFDIAKTRAGFITPVPGGVGPMTVATLMENTLLAQKLSAQ